MSTNRTSDNEESLMAASTPPSSPKRTPSSPVQQVRTQHQSTRSPKMGRRALHCSPKQGVSCQTQFDINYQQPEQIISINEHDQYSMTSQTSSTCTKGLDRVLLERNIEKLLERKESPQMQPQMLPHQSQQIRQLYQDRSREPLDLTDLGLSLDNLSPKTKASFPAIMNTSLTKDTMTTSSMPELPVYEISKFEEITPINEELPTPDISELTAKRDDPSQPICKCLRFVNLTTNVTNPFLFNSYTNNVEEGSAV